MGLDTSIFTAANTAIIEDIKKELRLQGHYATGALERSLESKEFLEGGNIILTAGSLGYLEDLEKGVTAANIQPDKINIAKLAQWVELKGLTSGEFRSAQSIAFAIIGKWKKLGKPLETSRAFSQTGEITKAVEISFDQNDKKYYDLIDRAVLNELDNNFHKLKSGTI